MAGVYLVIATEPESRIADTATVTVTSTVPSVTILLEESFENDNAASRGWYGNTAWTTTSTETHSGARSLAWNWASGQQLPTFGSGARHVIAATTELYVSYWVKYSANWVGSGVNFHPHEFTILTTANGEWTGPSFTKLTAYIEHVYNGGGIPQIGITDGENIDQARVGQDLSAVTENRAVAGCNGNTDGLATDCYAAGGTFNNGKWLRAPTPAFSASPGSAYKNAWHRVEVFFKMNSIVGGVGRADGVAQYWFDGNLVIDNRAFLFRTGANPTMAFNQFLIAPYIGVGSPATQSAWIDDLVIATGRP